MHSAVHVSLHMFYVLSPASEPCAVMRKVMRKTALSVKNTDATHSAFCGEPCRALFRATLRIFNRVSTMPESVRGSCRGNATIALFPPPNNQSLKK
ncbi:hypothetical protein CDAR_60841 [Caerostris darwini]|uniref:Secreted protein n=1 Tax=Caerostris darwini TaxID=1538125 RepID=A0AAV4VKK9_9ARAC|nr:hypothetical protein CDAR_60841 [Caerostris darwini]